MRKIVFFLLSVLVFQGTWAQENEISVEGIVTDASGMPIPGVNVSQQGTSYGVVTDFDGQYAVEVPTNAVLVFSYMGYETVEIEVAGQTQIDINMEPQTASLDEVVGYGSQKKVNLTGAV